MTVAEAIAVLQKFPPDWTLYFDQVEEIEGKTVGVGHVEAEVVYAIDEGEVAIGVLEARY